MLHLHRRLSDASLAPYFGQYFQRLRALHKQGVRWFNEVFVGRHHTAHLSIKQDNLHVGLEARDVATFEFFTTGNPIVASKNACIAVTATVQHNTVALSSQIRTGARGAHGQEISLVERPFQVQLIDEPVHELPPVSFILNRPKYFYTIYETWAPMHSHTGVHLTSYNHGKFTTSLVRTNQNPSTESIGGTLAGIHGAYSAHATRDVQVDQWWQEGFKGRPVDGAVLTDETAVPPADWPRASGLQVVKDDVWGTREFAIYIDAYSQVSVFPTSQIVGVPDAALDQNVNPFYVRTVRAALPSWVYQMSQRFKDWYAAHGTAGLTDFPENDWKIHPLGTKACAVVYKRQAVVFDAAFWDNGTPGGSMTAGDFGDYYQNYTGYGHRHDSNVVGTSGPRYISAPGLLEMGITIQLTGPGDEDYSLSTTMTVLRDPELTNFCTLFAGYVWHDMPDGSAKAGDLCVWDIERYYRTPTDELLDAIDTNGTKPLHTVTQDHERYWDAGAQHWEVVSGDPSGTGPPYSSRTTQVWQAGQGMSALGTTYLDSRRALYSLKNWTQGSELRTFPAPPSGVFAPETHPDFPYQRVLASVPAGGGPATATYDFIIKNALVTPWSPRAQFVKVDMATLSFVLNFKVGTVQYRNSIETTSPYPSGVPYLWFTYHPGTAVYTFNTFRESFFPDTLPQVQQDKLTYAMQNDFRAEFLAGNWTLLGLGAGPPGKSNTADWTDNELGVLRYWIVGITGEAIAFNGIPVLQHVPPLNTNGLGYPPWAPADLVYWWGAIETYARAVGLVLINNPRFHWYMYSDLIMNALAWTPWSTFFVHPNGTWALFDQSQVYNPNGVHMVNDLYDNSLYFTNLAATCDYTLLEHCIYDRVHLEFKLANAKYSADTTFRDLYNQAVRNAVDANIIPKGEVFTPIAPVDLKATFSKLPDASNPSGGIYIQAVWEGHTYVFHEDSVSRGGTGYVDHYGGNSGSIDLSLDYLFAGVSPQANAQHKTFSSCLLVETD